MGRISGVKGAIRILIGGGVLSAVAGPPAQAADAGWSVTAAPLALSLAAVALAAGGIALARLRAALRRSRRRARELQRQIDEMETVLASEPNALLIWDDRGEAPARSFMRLHVISGVPRDAEKLADFAGWLEEEAAARLNRALRALKREGRAFNISVKTRAGELLEADGRTAGYSISLRFRPVFGERRDAFEAIEASRHLTGQIERLSGLLDSAPLPVWLHDADGELLWANEAWLKAVDEPDFNVAVARGLSLVRPDAARDVQAGEDGARRYRADTIVGEEKRVYEIIEVRRDIGTVCWALDATREETLRRDLDTYIAANRRTLDKLDQAIAIFGPDQRLIFHNAAYAKLWDLDPAWLAGQPLDSEILSHLHEEGRLDIQGEFRKWRDARMAIYSTGKGDEDHWHMAGGRTLWVVAEPYADGGVIYIFTDITERLRLEARYRTLMDVQRETLDNLHEGIALFGTDGRLKLYNPSYAAFFGFDDGFLRREPHIDDIIGRCRQLVAEDGWWDDIKYAVTGMHEARHTLSDQTAFTDGRTFKHAAVTLPDGNTLLTWYDMTSVIEAERNLREKHAALMEADRMKADFLASISYELRTPLTSIMGFTELLESDRANPPNDAQREKLKLIRAASDELSETIDTILLLNSIDAGQLEPDIEPFDLTDLLKEVGDAMRAQARRRGVAIEVDAPDGLHVAADATLLTHALRHVLNNAIGYSGEGTTVRIGARLDGQAIEIRISDEGPGIDAAFIDSAFERFTTLSGANRGRGSTGLGLPLVKELVEMHDGSVRLESQLGHGTTVICRLPAATHRRKTS
ncbi:MAG TPA: PAS domain-containing protein [Thermopetrobacter sp.]|nr:PAS domain-containing protein [Thermopetrobacter sp.]